MRLFATAYYLQLQLYRNSLISPWSNTMGVLPALSPANEALLKLAALVQERAEIFAAPSTSRETAEDINRSALQATKRLFDECVLRLIYLVFQRNADFI